MNLRESIIVMRVYMTDVYYTIYLDNTMHSARILSGMQRDNNNNKNYPTLIEKKANVHITQLAKNMAKP